MVQQLQRSSERILGKCFILPDESKIQLDFHGGKQRVRRFVDERSKDFCHMPTVKFPQSLMIWGSFSHRGIGYLHVCEKTVDQHEYIKIIRTRVLQYKRRYFANDEMIFQDDSAPAHRDKSVSMFKDQIGLRWKQSLGLETVQTSTRSKIHGASLKRRSM